MKRLALSIASVTLMVLSQGAAAQDAAAPYSKTHKIRIGGEGGWDYLTADPSSQRLYVSRGNRIVVVDTGKEKVVGEVTGTPGVHGVALDPALSRGFTSNGGDDTVTAFDTTTLKVAGKVKVGGRPDAIHFDPESKRVFTFNHGSKDATAVDPSSITVVGTVPLDGIPEAAVSDGRGHVFVNLMDKNQVVEFDATSLTVLNRWPLAPGDHPTGLALDRKNRRLFSVCGGNQKMIVLDADKGNVIATVPIGQGSDGCAFDPERGLAFSSNGRDGTLTIVQEQSPEDFQVVGTVKTQMGARTMALDPKTHRVYLSTAEYAPTPADQPKTKGRRRPNIVPGSFAVLMLGD